MSTQTLTHTYSIREVAKLTGLPESTLRYYEEIGIVQPIQRDVSSKHRAYTEQDLSLLDSIACLSATGMSINDMREYMSNRESGADAAHEQIRLLQSQQKRLSDEARHQKVKQRYVQLKVAYWEAVKAGKHEQANGIAGQARNLVKVLVKNKPSVA